MLLQPVDKVEGINSKDFKENYYKAMKPLVITGLAKEWPAYNKWNWDYFIDIVGNQDVGVYNNIKSDAYTPINTADAYMKFGDYLKQVKNWPAGIAHFFVQHFSACSAISK
ncbi:MAG: cupin-like domain-containing protein [Ferruginibacter sp.]